MEDIGEFSDPVLMSFSEGSPRLVDTVFNVSSLTSGIFNNTLFQYAGVVILGIILFGKCDHNKIGGWSTKIKETVNVNNMLMTPP